ncbi:MAG: hypothetical protein OXQ31_10870 [Spirochaetaceae bacterium]|nr:hypothetical protein [Spirochaetaceae bacterium]
MAKRILEVPEKRYQPSKDELEEVARIDATPEEVARRVLQPAEVQEVNAAEWRQRRKRQRNGSS